MAAPAPGAAAAAAAQPAAGGDAAAGQGPGTAEAPSPASAEAALPPEGGGASGGAVGSRACAAAGDADGSHRPAAEQGVSFTSAEGGQGSSPGSPGHVVHRKSGMRKAKNPNRYASVGVSEKEHLFVTEDKDELQRHLRLCRIVSKTTTHISNALGPQEILEWLWTSCKKFWEGHADINVKVCLRENFAPDSFNAGQHVEAGLSEELCCLDLSASSHRWANDPSVGSNEDVCQWFGKSTRFLPSEWLWQDLDQLQNRSLRLSFKLSQIISDWQGPKGFQYSEHAEADFKSFVYLPLSVRTECLGVVVVASTSCKEFDPADLDIFMAVSEVTAVHLKSQQMQFEMDRRRIAVEMDRARHRELASAYRELLNDMLPSHVVDELRQVRMPSDLSRWSSEDSPLSRFSPLSGDAQVADDLTLDSSEICGSSSIPVLVEDKEYAHSRRMMRRPSRSSKLCSAIPSHITSQLDKLTYAEYHECVAILFSDVKGFTGLSEVADPAEIMLMLDDLFGRFDSIVERHAPAAYKVETIGDAYMIAFGLFGQTGFTEETPTDYAVALRAIVVGAEMIAQSQEVMTPSREGNARPVEIRVGIHFGRIMSGIIGRKVPRYCMFGDTVNTASRMESTGVPGQIHVTDSVHRACMQGTPGKDLPFSSTGGLQVKGKGWMRTFLLDAQKVIDLEICPPDEYAETLPFARRKSENSSKDHPDGGLKESRQHWLPRLARLVDALCRGRLPGSLAT